MLVLEASLAMRTVVLLVCVVVVLRSRGGESFESGRGIAEQQAERRARNESYFGMRPSDRVALSLRLVEATMVVVSGPLLKMILLLRLS